MCDFKNSSLLQICKSQKRKKVRQNSTISIFSEFAGEETCINKFTSIILSATLKQLNLLSFSF
jgi:hypothetical protein